MNGIMYNIYREMATIAIIILQVWPMDQIGMFLHEATM